MLKNLDPVALPILGCHPLVLKSLGPPMPSVLKSLESMVAQILKSQPHSSCLLSWQRKRRKLVEVPKGNNLESHPLLLKSLYPLVLKNLEVPKGRKVQTSLVRTGGM